ncbi:hypothetical protein [Leptospira ryugenii]|uniref:hypothetical protein n=1 Tax=Leptospira ryugenii TaxID=1917863 RepID=UPI001FCE588B|nr:hypothetical protein [Leptospira ryugenii]
MNLLILFLSVHLFADPVKKSDELCSCLKDAKESKNEKSKKKCLQLREKHVKALKKNSPEYNEYIERLNVCERQLMGAGDIDANLSTEKKIEAVCNCFQNKAQQKMMCFKLQSDYAKTIANDEERASFNVASGSCDK